MLPDRLTTARLTLRPLTPQDEAGVVEALNKWDVTRWLTRPPYPYSAQDFRDWLPHASPGATFAIDEVGRFAGVVGLEGGALGYWLTPAAQGRGLMTEACTALLAAHDAASTGPVTSGYYLGNDASARVLAKLGFHPTHVEQVESRALGRALPLQRMRRP